MAIAAKQGESRSEEIIRKHKEFLWPAVANSYAKPLVADHASMQYLWDIEGNKYLDFFGGIVTIGVGHCNPKVTSKIKAQVDKLQHTSTLFPNEQIVALAEKLAQITPGKLQKSFFTNSGTEANEAAILLARMAGPSYDVVALRHAYAGSSMLAKSVTAQAAWRKSGVISVGISHAVNPYCYRCPLHLKYPDSAWRARTMSRTSFRQPPADRSLHSSPNPFRAWAASLPRRRNTSRLSIAS